MNDILSMHVMSPYGQDKVTLTKDFEKIEKNEKNSVRSQGGSHKYIHVRVKVYE